MPSPVTISDLLAKKAEQVNQTTSVEQSIFAAINGLIRYLDGKVTQTEVVNQLKSIGTPDVIHVVRAIEQLDKDVLSNKLDLSPLKDGLSALEEQLKQIPKVLPEQKGDIKVSNLSEISSDVGKEFDRAIKNLKLEAPKVEVNVPAPKVNVEKPNLVPLQSIFKDLLIAVKANKPVASPVTDVSGVEKRLDSVVELSTTQQKTQTEANKLLKAIANRPMGGGGSGSKGVYSDISGNLAYPQLTYSGSVPTESPALALQLDTTTTLNTIYIGKAAIGTATSSAVWQVFKLDTTSGLVKTWADGNAKFDNIYDNRASLSYS